LYEFFVGLELSAKSQSSPEDFTLSFSMAPTTLQRQTTGAMADEKERVAKGRRGKRGKKMRD
jgi:hypothetical protein